MSSTDESLLAGGGESSPADRIHAEDGAAKTIDEKERDRRAGDHRRSRLSFLRLTTIMKSRS